MRDHVRAKREGKPQCPQLTLEKRPVGVPSPIEILGYQQLSCEYVIQYPLLLMVVEAVLVATTVAAGEGLKKMVVTAGAACAQSRAQAPVAANKRV